MTFTKNTLKLWKDRTFQNVLIFAIVVMIIITISKEYIAYNFTESEPTGIYLLSSATQIKKNDIVTISININTITKLADERHYTTAYRFLKTVMGVPGDTITIKDSIIYINNEVIGKIHTVDSQNRPLPSDIKEGVIPPQYYFLASRRHENSFDSRYFGLVSKECIRKKAEPLYVKN